MSKFEVNTLFKGEIKRWIWLMVAVFAAITLYEYTSFVNGGNFVSYLFSESPNTKSTHYQSPHDPPPKNYSESVHITNHSNPAFPPGGVVPVSNLTTKDHLSLKESFAPAPLILGEDGDYDDDGVDVISPAANDPNLSENDNYFNRRKHSLGNTSSITVEGEEGHNSTSTALESPPPAVAPTIFLSEPNNNNTAPVLLPPPPSVPPPFMPPPLQEKAIPVAPAIVNQPPKEKSIPASVVHHPAKEKSIPAVVVHQPAKEKSIPAVVNHDQSPLKLKKDVYSLRDMDELLAEGLRSTRSMVPLWPSIADRQLVHAKSEIQNARLPPTGTGLYGPLYRNVTQFYRSYELMERTLKVYVYKEGDRPVFHRPNLQGIYASEGWFMKHMESSKKFLTNDPKKAHLFYLPFSSQLLVTTFYVPDSHRRGPLIQYLKDYVDGIVAKYPYWNRTGGADHFLISCHDWAPDETREIMSTCIRALCNADVNVGSFQFGKDISLPETNVHAPKTPLKSLGGKPPSQRKTLAFFAGQINHGYLRPILLKYWENRDPDIKIFGQLPKTKGNRNYISYMQDSKYCICPRGYEVNSPRVVEAIFHECVPVIISDNFIPPMFETLNWESFVVFVTEKDVPRLKEILVAIPEKTYLRLYMRVKMVQRHFLWNVKPVKYDLFHMILHSVWFNRVNQFQQQQLGE